MQRYGRHEIVGLNPLEASFAIALKRREWLCPTSWTKPIAFGVQGSMGILELRSRYESAISQGVEEGQ